MEKYEVHPICALVPGIGDEDYKALCDSVEAQGLLEPIILYEGKILDGRSRYNACRITKTAMRFEQANPADAVKYVIAKNLHRRHLDASQKAMMAASVKGYYATGAEKRQLAGVEVQDCTKGTANEQAGKSVGVSARSVATASKVIEAGAPELVDAVRAGKVKVSDAAKIVDQPKAKQAAAVKDVQEGKAKTVAAAVAPKKKPPKQGKVVGNFAAVKEALEKITRAADDLNRERNGGKFHRAFLDGIEKCHVALGDWRKVAR